MQGQQYSCQLPATARSVTEARRFVLDALASWQLESVADTAALLTSEVVTNAVLHARTPLGLVVRREDVGISVAVTDGSRRRPTQRKSTPDATNGRGLSLLGQLATTWEVQVHRTGKTVRFTVTGESDPWAAFTIGDWAVDG